MNTESNTLQSSCLTPSILLWPVIMILVGVLALWLPRVSSIGFARVLGWLMVFDGGFQLLHSFRSKGVGHVAWKVLVAVIYLVLGIYFLMHSFLAVALVTLTLAIFFLFEGLVDVFSYFATHNTGASYWVLVNGIVCMVLAVMIWRHWPTGTLRVLGVWVGVGMLMTGMSRLMMAVAIRTYAKQSDREASGDLHVA